MGVLDNPGAIGNRALDDERLLGPDGRVAPGWSTVIAGIVGLSIGPSVVLIMCFGVFAPALHGAFGWSVAAITVGASILSLMIMLVSPLQGLLIDAFGPKRVVMTSTPIFGAALLAMSALPNDIRLFYLACVVLPVAGLGLWPLAFMKTTAGWFDRNLGLSLGVTNIGLGVGATLLPIVLGLIFARLGWRTAYLGLGAATLVVAWPVAGIWLRESPHESRARIAASPGPATGLRFGAALATRAFWITAFGFIALGCVSTGLLVHQVAILIQAGFSMQAAIYLQSAVGIGSIAGRVVAGWALDRTSVRAVGAVTFLTAALACAAFASPWAALLALPAALAVGLIIGAEFDILGVLIRRYHGDHAFGRVYGIIFSAFQFGAALGAGGLAYSRSVLHGYGPGLLVLCLFCVLAGIVFLALGPYRFGPKASAAPDVADAPGDLAGCAP